MGFDMRGAVQGAAYANWFNQQARYRLRTEKQEMAKQARMEELQQQGLALERYKAETEDARGQERNRIERQKNLQMEIKNQMDRDRFEEEQKTHELARKGEQAKQQREGRDAFLDLVAPNRPGTEGAADIETERHNRAMEEIYGDREAGRTTRAQATAAARKANAEKDIPSSPGGVFTRTSDIVADVDELLMKEGRAPWGGDYTYDDLLAYEDVLYEKVRKRAAPVVEAYNFEARLYNDSLQDLPPGSPAQPRELLDVDTIIDIVKGQSSNEETPIGRKLSSRRKQVMQGDYTDDQMRGALNDMDTDPESAADPEKAKAKINTLTEQFNTGTLPDVYVVALKIYRPKTFARYLENLDARRGAETEEQAAKRLDEIRRLLDRNWITKEQAIEMGLPDTGDKYDMLRGGN